MSGFKPGQPKPANSGRKAGTPNKSTQEMLAVFEEFRYDPARALCELLPELEPSQQAMVHLKLMEFKYPKRKAVEVTGADGGAIEVTPVVPATNEERLALVKAIKGGA